MYTFPNKNLKHCKKALLALVIVFSFSLTAYFVPATAYAEDAAAPPAESTTLKDDGVCAPNDTQCVQKTEDGFDCNGDGQPDKECNAGTFFADKYVNPFIKLLASLAVLGVIIGIIWGGIEYASSGGDPQRVNSAKTHIRNSLLALLFFFFLYALLNFLIPGNLIKG